MDFVGILRQLIISAPAILIAIVFHELAHGWMAYKLGDKTAKYAKRLTLNPVAHIDPFGTIILPFILLLYTNGQWVFGYAKPVPVNPYNFKNPRAGMALTAVAGPLANIAVGVLCTFTGVRVLPILEHLIPFFIYEPLIMIIQATININIVLAAFNLIPVPPLDGGRILLGVLPVKYSQRAEKYEQFGFLIVMVLIITGLTKYFVLPLVIFFEYILSLI